MPTSIGSWQALVPMGAQQSRSRPSRSLLASALGGRCAGASPTLTAVSPRVSGVTGVGAAMATAVAPTCAPGCHSPAVPIRTSDARGLAGCCSSKGTAATQPSARAIWIRPLARAVFSIAIGERTAPATALDLPCAAVSPSLIAAAPHSDAAGSVIGGIGVLLRIFPAPHGAPKERSYCTAKEEQRPSAMILRS